MPSIHETLVPAFGECLNRLHDNQTAARLIGVSPATLATDRSARRQLRVPYLRLGTKIAYRESDLLAWLDSHSVEG
jgi:hypothetical protein